MVEGRCHGKTMGTARLVMVSMEVAERRWGAFNLKYCLHRYTSIGIWHWFLAFGIWHMHCIAWFLYCRASVIDCWGDRVVST
jgi:hypothetical protein